MPAQPAYVRPLECFLAEAKGKALVDLTTYATVVYVVAYRTIPPLLSAFRYMFNSNNPSVFRAGVLSAMNAACSSSVGLISAVQVMSIISFLVPPYFISENEHANADCQAAMELQLNANRTSAYACHKAEADEVIFKKILGYNIGLYTGVYVALPIVVAAIMGWKKAYAAAHQPASPQPDVVLSVVEDNSPLGFAEAMARGLKEGVISAAQYSLFDAAAFTAIINFVMPLYTYVKKVGSQKECDYELEVERARAGS